MKTTTLAVIAILPVAFTSKAQDCTSSFFPSKEGTKIEMTSFDKIEEAWDRVVRGDVKYRFVLDLKTLKK